MHIRAKALQKWVCCLPTFRCGGCGGPINPCVDNGGDGTVCDVDEDCIASADGAICGGVCETLTAPDCEALGGFSRTGSPVCQPGDNGS